MNPPTTKACNKCGEVKPLTKFAKQRCNKTYGLQARCKDCNLIDRRAYKKANPDERRLYAVRRYGLTLDDFDALWRGQNGLCAICSKELVIGPRNGHAIDHNHDTGEVRGILCGNCNKGLGLFLDNSAHLLAAVQYLQMKGSYGRGRTSSP